MTITLHWWWVPSIIATVGVLILAFTRNEGGNFPMPSWHAIVGPVLLLVAACLVAGHFL